MTPIRTRIVNSTTVRKKRPRIRTRVRRTRDLLLLLGLRSRTTPTTTTRQTPAHCPRLSALACRSSSASRGDFEYLTKFQAHP